MEEGQSLGAYLKRIREEKKSTVDEVAAELNIKKEHVEAIESDTILNFVPTAYARGFVRNYAVYLGLDRHSVSERFDSIHTTDTPQIYVKDVGPLVSLERRPRRRKGVSVYITFAFAAAAVLAGIYGHQRYFGTRHGGSSPFVEEKKSTSGDVSRSKKDAGEAVTDHESGYVLEVKFIMNATVKPTIDGTDTFGGGKIIGTGKTEKFSAQNSLVLEIDEASNVEVFHKGEKVPDLGQGRIRLTLDQDNQEKPKVEKIDQQPAND